MKRVPEPLLDSLRFAGRHFSVQSGLVIALLACAGLVAVAAGYSWPMERRIEEARRSLAAAQTELVRLGQMRDLDTVAQEAGRRVRQLEERLESVVRQAPLAANLHRLAERHGVLLLSQSYERGRRDDRIVTLSQEVSVRGTYAGIRGFLHGISTLPTWTTVETIALERSPTAEDTVRATVRIRTLILDRRAAEAPGS